MLVTFQLFSAPLSIDFTKALSFEPGEVAPLSPSFIHVPQPRDGPVLIKIDVHLDATRGSEIGELMNELRLIHLRNGAYSWQLFADPTRQNHFHVEIVMPSWSQYLILCERITKAEKQVVDRALGLCLGENPPETQVYIRVNKVSRENAGARAHLKKKRVGWSRGWHPVSCPNKSRGRSSVPDLSSNLACIVDFPF